MADHGASRFTPQNKTTNERLSTQTVGLVALSDFRKRRAEVLEQQEREAREAAISGTSTPDRSLTGTPDHAGSDGAESKPAEQQQQKPVRGGEQKQRKKQKRQGKKLLSFHNDDDDDDDDGAQQDEPEDKESTHEVTTAETNDATALDNAKVKAKFKANAAVGILPKAVTTSALRKEATQREALRREFVAIQEAVKATEVAIPFVFYDGAHVPGGMVRVKKGDFVWVFLDKSRKAGAERNVGERGNARRAWARVGVDDLMLVRDTIIIPHHYDLYYFIVNKSTGPGGRRIFDYSADAPVDSVKKAEAPAAGQLSTAESRAAAAAQRAADMKTLEGALDEATRTKVVDRRWYQRNKHIYPASTWQEFDPEKDYANAIRKDNGGNTYFFASSK